MTAHPGLHSLYSTGSGGATGTFTGRTGLVFCFTDTRFGAARLTRRDDRFAAARKDERRPALRPVRVVLVARIVPTLTGPLYHRSPVVSNL